MTTDWYFCKEFYGAERSFSDVVTWRMNLFILDGSEDKTVVFNFLQEITCYLNSIKVGLFIRIIMRVYMFVRLRDYVCKHFGRSLDAHCRIPFLLTLSCIVELYRLISWLIAEDCCCICHVLREQVSHPLLLLKNSITYHTWSIRQSLHVFFEPVWHSEEFIQIPVGSCVKYII